MRRRTLLAAVGRAAAHCGTLLRVRAHASAMPAIVDASDIARKPHVPDDHRTPSRDEVAAYIEEEIVAEGKWPMPVKHIADELGCSRSHVTKVLDLYFTIVSDQDRRAKYAPSLDVHIELPDGLATDSEREAYVRGWVQGWHRAHDAPDPSE